MKDEVRRAVAYVAGRLVSGKAATGLYDRNGGRQYPYSGDFTATKLSVRDHTENLEFTGAGGSGMYTLSHTGNGKPVSLKIQGQVFEGFDYSSAKKYRGSVNGNMVSIIDDQVGQEFQYTL